MSQPQPQPPISTMSRYDDALVIIFFVSFFLFNANFNFTMTTIAPLARHHHRKASHDDPTAATIWDGTITDNDNSKKQQ
jgi:hypothetical protein